METFAAGDLPHRAAQLIREAELGHFALVTKNDQPIFITLPVSGAEGLGANNRVSLAVNLFDQELLTQGEAAQLAGLCLAEFFEACAVRKVSVVRYTAEELHKELEQINELHRR